MFHFYECWSRNREKSSAPLPQHCWKDCVGLSGIWLIKLCFNACFDDYLMNVSESLIRLVPTTQLTLLHGFSLKNLFRASFYWAIPSFLTISYRHPSLHFSRVWEPVISYRFPGFCHLFTCAVFTSSIFKHKNKNRGLIGSSCADTYRTTFDP